MKAERWLRKACMNTHGAENLHQHRRLEYERWDIMRRFLKSYRVRSSRMRAVAWSSDLEFTYFYLTFTYLYHHSLAGLTQAYS